MVQLRKSMSHEHAVQNGNGLAGRLLKRGVAVTSRGRGIAQRGAADNTMFMLVSMASGILGGALAGALFSRLWRAVSGADEVPEPTALDRSVKEIVIAGVLQGAVFGLVKAIVGRITATSYRRFTGKDPTH
jgi:Protein of unknown function (DUF4235)